MKRRALLGFGIAALLITLFVYAVGWDDVLGATAGADLGIYALAFLSVAICLAFRSMTWVRVLRTVNVTLSRRLIGSVFLTSMFAKYVTPYGQVAASPGIAYVLSQYSDVNYEEDFAAVVSADFLNYLPYYTFGLIGFGYLLQTTAQLPDFGGYAVAIPALVVGVAGALSILWYRRGLVERGIVAALRPLRWLVALVSEERANALTREAVEQRLSGFYETLELVSTSRRDVLIALGYAHAGWFFLMVPLYLVGLSLGIALPLGIAMLVVALSKVGFVVPLPGGLGGVEITLAGLLYLTAGVDPATATAAAILYRFASYWFTVLVGGLTSIWLSIR